MSYERGVLVPVLVRAVDVAVRELDQGRSDHLPCHEVWPPFTSPGVGGSAHGNQTSGVVVVKLPDVPGSGSCRLGTILHLSEVCIGQGFQRLFHDIHSHAPLTRDASPDLVTHREWGRRGCTDLPLC